jgi:Protein of unknown function (DUF3175)
VAKRVKANPAKAPAVGHRSTRAAPRKWSATVTRNSNALDLERKVFAKAKPEAIARSLKRSAQRSRRRKGAPYRSAMAMLTFYINRAGKNLPKSRRLLLERTKVALRKAFARQ